MRARVLAVAGLVTILPAAAARAQGGPPSPLGQQVWVRPLAAGVSALRGELIAVSADSLWVLGDAGLSATDLSAVRAVTVRRHGFRAKQGLIWGAIGGVATGLGLSAACSSVSGDCGGVFTGMLVSWGVVAALSGISLESSAWRTVTDSLSVRLRPYARFPQGWPEGLDRSVVRRRS